MTAKICVLELPQNFTSQDIRNGATDVYRLELELNKARSSSSASKKVRSRDRLAELLSHRKGRSGLAMETI